MVLGGSGGELPCQVSNRARIDHEIVGERRGGESQLQFDSLAFETADGSGGLDINGRLRQGGDSGGFLAENAESLAVNPCQTGETMGLAGPMNRIGIGEFVAG